jgi:beta-galactosidase
MPIALCRYFFLVALLSLGLAAHAQQAGMGAETSLDLNGTWAFRTDPNDRGETQRWYQPAADTAGWDRLPVPGNWDLRNEYASYVGKGWYRKTVTLPAALAHKTVRLCFEAVYHDCTVWLNGRKLGENHGGFLPFEFDVTALLNYGAPNTVVVCADNTYRRGALWNWGGIRRPVSLRATAAIRIVRQHITPVVNLSRRSAAVSVKVLLKNHGATAQAVRGTVTLSAPNGYRRTLPFAVSVAPQAQQEVTVSTALAAGQVHLWHFDDPYLYTSAVVLDLTGQAVQDRFGLRKVEVDNQNHTFRLNGESIRPMGFNLVPDDRTTGNTLPLWRIKEDIDLLKAAGCTMARLVHLRLPKEALDYLDERGMLTFAEVPLWGFDQLADSAQARPREWLARMVAEDYNHPSIIGWSVGNEIGDFPGALAYTQAATRHARQLDPTRLAVMVSHSAARNQNDPLQFSDLGLINGYTQNLGQQASKVHRDYPNRILFYSEFGYNQFTENLDGDLPVQAMLDSMRGRPYLIGGALWTFNDYRSNYVGTKGYSQNRPWGIVDVFRQPKRAYYSWRRELAPVRRVAVAGLDHGRTTAVITPRRVLDLPAYTLTGYRLVWRVADDQGHFVRGGYDNLPAIRPGSATLRRELPWAARAGWAQVNLALVSPLGYAMYDTTLYFQKPSSPHLLSAQSGRTRQNDPTANTGTLRLTFKPSTGAAAYQARYGLQELTKETAPTVNSYLDIPNLAFGQTYQVAVVAANGAGLGEPSPAQAVSVAADAYPAPVVQYVEPADGGFFVGYATEVDDYLFQVQYTTQAGNYAQAPVVQASTKGVLFVPGLTNGQAYFFRLRRLKDNNYPTAWSDEHRVMPDGGQLPASPVVAGVLRRGSEALVVLAAPVKKATGYTLHYRTPGTGATDLTHYVAAAHLDYLPLPGLRAGQAYLLTVTAHGASGESRPSAPTTVAP